MKQIYIFCSSFLNPQSGQLLIGGVQTYINSLCLLGKDKGYSVTVFQLESDIEANFVYNNAKVIICQVTRTQTQKYFDTIYKQYNSCDSIFIVITDQMPISSKAVNVITIQHGIAFDIPGEYICGLWGKNKLMHHINKLLRCIKNVTRFYKSANTVCVDYNFYNWFRTIGTIYPNKKVKVIPNYSSSCITNEELAFKLSNKSSIRRILFARRFYDYRGTILFSNVVERLLNKYSNIEVTFAGSGPLENYIKQKFSNYECVKISSFNANDSIAYHKQYDIAVVPTIFSEGTSLSLIEAMSAGCFPIATHVGGMTNIVLDGYNGILCSPDEESLYRSLVKVVEMEDQEFNSIVENAYYSSIKAFSLDIWKQKWSEFIDEVLASAK